MSHSRALMVIVLMRSMHINVIAILVITEQIVRTILIIVTAFVVNMVEIVER